MTKRTLILALLLLMSAAIAHAGLTFIDLNPPPGSTRTEFVTDDLRKFGTELAKLRQHSTVTFQQTEDGTAFLIGISDGGSSHFTINLATGEVISHGMSTSRATQAFWIAVRASAKGYLEQDRQQAINKACLEMLKPIEQALKH